MFIVISIFMLQNTFQMYFLPLFTSNHQEAGLALTLKPSSAVTSHLANLKQREIFSLSLLEKLLCFFFLVLKFIDIT